MSMTWEWEFLSTVLQETISLLIGFAPGKIMIMTIPECVLITHPWDTAHLTLGTSLVCVCGHIRTHNHARMCLRGETHSFQQCRNLELLFMYLEVTVLQTFCCQCLPEEHVTEGGSPWKLQINQNMMTGVLIRWFVTEGQLSRWGSPHYSCRSHALGISWEGGKWHKPVATFRLPRLPTSTRHPHAIPFTDISISQHSYVLTCSPSFQLHRSAQPSLISKTTIAEFYWGLSMCHMLRPPPSADSPCIPFTTSSRWLCHIRNADLIIQVCICGVSMPRIVFMESKQRRTHIITLV